MTSRFPAEVFPEHLLGIRDLTDKDDFLELILVADKIIESQDAEITEYSQDAARYKLLIQILPDMMASAVQDGIAGDLGDLTNVEVMKSRIPLLEEFLDSILDC